METRDASLAALESKMAVYGVTRTELARASGIAGPNVFAIFSGRQYCGPTRLRRLNVALDTLAAAKETTSGEQPPAEPRVRHL